MNRNLIEQIKKIDIFNGLSDEALMEITQQGTLRILKAGDALMKKGETGNSLFLIHSGLVKIITEDSKGDEVILNKCGAGEAIGEMALLDSSPRSAGAVALEDCEALEISRETFQKILDARPDVSLQIIRKYSHRLRFATTYIERAIDWAQKIAEGDYSFIEQSQPLLNEAGSDNAKAAQLLSAFFTMVNKVKAREEDLRKEVAKLSFEIDQERRKKDFEEITGTEFYSNLKEQAKTLRMKRAQQNKSEES